MISLIRKISSAKYLAQNNNILQNVSNNTKLIYPFSIKEKEFGEMLKQIDQQNIQLGQAQFRQLYFPIKRLHFESATQFQKIYSNSSNSLKNIKRHSRIMRLTYHIPFFGYYLNYLFFLAPDSLIHQGILASLFLGANLKSLYESMKISREISELYLSQDAKKFIAVLPKMIVSTNINELEGKLKGSIFEIGECQGFTFTLDDIEQISLVSNDKQTIDKQLTEKIGGKKINVSSEIQKLNQAEQKQQILEKLSQIQENQECLILTISKQSWQGSRSFMMNLSNNDLSQYNDYMVALGYKQRIVMRESMAPNYEENKKQSPVEEQPQQSEQKQDKKEQIQAAVQ